MSNESMLPVATEVLSVSWFNFTLASLGDSLVPVIAGVYGQFVVLSGVQVPCVVDLVLALGRGCKVLETECCVFKICVKLCCLLACVSVKAPVFHG